MNQMTPPPASMLSRMLSRAPAEMPFGLLQRESERLFDQFSRAFGGDGGWFGAAAAPAVDITDSPKALLIAAELPGMSEKDIDISIQDGVLTLRGEKQDEKEEKEGNRYVAERRYGAFLRTFALPSGIDEAGIKATFEKGVLKIALPKLPEAQSKARKIEVAAAK